MTQHSLFDPVTLGNFTLRNRIVMSPMTRSRGSKNGVPSPLAIDYYKQRSQAGLIITEGTSPSPNGSGYARTPGIYSPEQISSWQKVTYAIHKGGGKIFLQIMHVGRVAHPLNKPDNAQTVAPSAIQVKGEMYTDDKGMQPMPIPLALEVDEIQKVIEEYRQATINAFEAGFDGVEFHASSGYLPMQFLSSNSNLRTDNYGGSVANRIRFLVETLTAMNSVKGSSSVGMRIWPGLPFNDMLDANPIETYTELLKAVNPMMLAYIHSTRSPDPTIDIFKLVRNHFDGISIVNGGFDFHSGQAMIQSGEADLIAYATLYLANPDLIERFKKNAAFNEPDKNTFYTPGEKGYTDYPLL
jgi:N-ethylmaleimide reductase